MNFSRALTFAALLLPLPAMAAPVPPADLAKLKYDVTNAESVRAAKDLQIAYSQYSQAGMWRDMADLFAEDGEVIYGKDNIKGPDAIAAYFRDHFGAGRDGLAPGAVHVQFALTPVVTLSPDGKTARGRWHEIAMLGQPGSAGWSGGIMENEYVKQGGRWKIKLLHYYAMFAGPYETGWRNLDSNLPIITPHYTGHEAGSPVPTLASDADIAGVKPGSMGELTHRIAMLNAEDGVRNIQNIYGYYIDRKMWDDVTDLVTPDALLEIAGVGIYRGPKGIRKALDAMGPAGLAHGELNDQVQLNFQVAVAPDGLSARSRGLEWDFLGQADKEQAQWGLRVVEGAYVKIKNKWHIRELRLFPVMKADYREGWGKSTIVDPTPTGRLSPDGPAPAGDTAKNRQLIPAFFLPNPATGKPVAYPVEAAIVARMSLRSAPTGHAVKEEVSLAQARLGLERAKAYDATENLSSAFGYSIDDFEWPMLGDLFAPKGAREEPFSGFFIGPERIKGAETAQWGTANPSRTSIQIHIRTQPVIDVADNARSVRFRTRMIHMTSYNDKAGTFFSGMYPNEQAVYDSGAWKFWSVAIDESYFSSADYATGWATVKDRTPEQLATRRPNILLSKYPPDIPVSALGARERGQPGGTGTIIEWPSIKPMYFHYVNPVSGRIPPDYMPDCATCTYDPKTSAKANGY